MPGRMDDNLRRGNNSENLGMHLLRAIGAVAPVPRDQDVGIDAIVTLLQRDKGRRLVAGPNVFVQLKSSSVRKLVFEEDDVDWLQRLELPYFIGSVSQEDSSISLYTVQPLLTLGRGVRAELFLDETNGCLNTVNSEEEFNEWLTLEERTRTSRLFLGPPVLEWTIDEVRDAGFMETSNAVLGVWVLLIQENRLLQTIGETKTVNWKTGAAPEESGSIGAYSSHDDTGGNAVNLLNIALKRVSMLASMDGDVTALRSLLEAVSHFKKYGVEDKDILAAGVAAKISRKPK